MVGESSSSGLRNVRGRVTPWTGFLGTIGTNALSVVSLRTGRSSIGPKFGIAHYFWAGPHRCYFSLSYHGSTDKCFKNHATKVTPFKISY